MERKYSYINTASGLECNRSSSGIGLKKQNSIIKYLNIKSLNLLNTEKNRF